jgi:hypothetical protein
LLNTAIVQDEVGDGDAGRYGEKPLPNAHEEMIDLAREGFGFTPIHLAKG